MAKLAIDRLNYMTTGRNRIFLNVDHRLQSFPEPVAVYARTERGEGGGTTLVSADGLPALLTMDDYRGSEAFAKWAEEYTKRNTVKNVTFDIEIDQTEREVNDTDKFLPMYDMVDVHVKSALANRKDNFEKFDDDSNQCEDLYNPDLTDNPVQFCKAGQRTYMMTTPTPYESQIIDISLQNQGGGLYYTPSLVDSPHNTVFMGTLASLSSVDGSAVSSLGQYFGELSADSAALQRAVDDYFSGTRQISGVQYNHLLALLHTNSQRWSNPRNMVEYGNGNVYAEIHPLKNMYDSTYTTQMDAPLSVHNTRRYCGLGQSRDRVYLKFQDDIDIGVGPDGNTITNVPSGRTWQKIESMEPAVVGYQQNARHKSLYFSIRLNDTGLQAAESEGSSELDIVRKDVENSIREIAAKFAPANTQLFEIQIEG